LATSDGENGVHASTSPSYYSFYLDLGSIKYVDGIWLDLLQNPTLQVTYSKSLPLEANPLSSVVSTSGNNSNEWWVQISDTA